MEGEQEAKVSPETTVIMVIIIIMDRLGGPPPYRGYGGGMFPPPGPSPRHDTVIVSSNPFGEVMAFIVTIIIVFVLAFGMKISNNSSIPKSTQNREKNNG
ncbi:MAG: hypothetical protein ACLTS6_21100 [Anaerobutyricum sp.]